MHRHAPSRDAWSITLPSSSRRVTSMIGLYAVTSSDFPVSDNRYSKWKKEQYESYEFTGRDAQLSLGHFTTNLSQKRAGVEDDVPHTSMPHYKPPKYVTPPLGLTITLDTLVDLVFFDFYASKVLTIVNLLSTNNKTYSASDVQGWDVNGPLITNGIYEALVKET
ncbi:hypothetical protein FRC07_014023 [Ceratobasidium sp. 392]|nr:hypothetical protein FRC07_014023 [Ceratobasidium sp. 392]